ncbi:MAG: DUF3047 domain-containing protein [Smithellaceae bacterium]
MLNKLGNIYKRIFTGRQIIFTILFIACLMGAADGAAKIDPEIIDIGNFNQAGNGQGVPEGWQLVKYKGNPALKLVSDGHKTFLRLTCSGQTASGIKKDISVDVRKYSYLHWSWQALRLPERGDIRLANHDDQALQIYVIFPGTGFPELYKSPTVAYIWDNEAPKGLMIGSPQRSMGYVRYIVIKNKTDALGKWYQETRNILEDYRKLFPEINRGEPPGPIRSILLFINTHHTKSSAEGHIGNIYFSPTDKCKRN